MGSGRGGKLPPQKRGGNRRRERERDREIEREGERERERERERGRGRGREREREREGEREGEGERERGRGRGRERERGTITRHGLLLHIALLEDAWSSPIVLPQIYSLLFVVSIVFYSRYGPQFQTSIPNYMELPVNAHCQEHIAK